MQPHIISKNYQNNYNERAASYNSYNSQSQNPMRARIQDQKNPYDARQSVSVEDRLKNFVKNGETVLPSAPRRDSDSSHKNPQRPIVPPKPLGNRSSFQPAAQFERTESRNSNRSNSNYRSSNTSELRSQLPWSYTSAPSDAPKKAFPQLNEREEFPHVPVPDYYFNKNRQRSNLNDDNDGGELIS